jgi:uracil-DNA glycosylase
MTHSFDPGYGAEPWRTLVADYPGHEVYPADEFRLEWGPIFHRGRLDGSARVLVLGQDPAASESIVRRILVGEAGHRTQGFLAKLGIDRSYVMVNTFLYSLYGQAGSGRWDDQDLVEYRHRWLDALLLDGGVEAVVALGQLADRAWSKWKQEQPQRAGELAYAHITHPTAPESGSGGDPTRLAEATAAMLSNWNQGLEILRPHIAHPDAQRSLVRYGASFRRSERVAIPEQDLPAGLPSWMGSAYAWAERVGPSAEEKRATITVVVPATLRPWH